MNQSIYQMICDNTTYGILDKNFSLPDKNTDPSMPRFAPGALDGITIYHMSPRGLNADQTKEMARAVRTASDGDYAEAEKLFAAWTKGPGAVSVVDELQHYVISHAEQLDPENLFNTARSMVLYSDNTECVKIGMELLELFSSLDENTKEIIRWLGQYEEFTLFAVWNMLKWENGNQEIFELAKKVFGWGRIHAVEQLEPETEEIRRWLLTEGYKNGVRNSYTALTCWQKSQAEKILTGAPTASEYKNLSEIIDALLDENPVPGISAIENAEEILLRFLSVTPSCSPDIRDYDVIQSIKIWSEDKNNLYPAVTAACSEILRSPSCTETIKKALTEGNGFVLADALQIPFRAQLYECMSRDFDTYHPYCRYLLNNGDYVQKTLELFRKELPLSEIEGEPVDDLCLGPEYVKHNQMQFILMELDELPLTGTDFIEAALKSPAARNRYMALDNLCSWVQKTGQPLADLSPELYAAVKELKEKEINDGNMTKIDPLLDGRTTFTEETGE